jgi:hypothetical protein
MIKNTKKGEQKASEGYSGFLFLTDLLFEGFKHYFVAFFDGDVVGSADWTGNKLVFSD